MAKRKNGEGSYGTKLIKGVTYHYYRDSSGKYIYAKTASELKEKKKANENKAKLNFKANKASVYSELVLEWLKTKKRSLSPRVYDDYEKTINRYIVNNGSGYDIGNLQIRSLTPENFSQFFDALAQKYSKSSIDKVWYVTKGPIEYGIDEDVIPLSFKIRKIERPNEKRVAVKKKEVPFITENDMDLLYKECMTPEKYGNAARAIVFIMYSGLRVNELTALTWRDVESDYSYINVRSNNSKVVVRDKLGNPIKNEDGTLQYKYVTKDPKSETGKRRIPMPSRAKEVLEYMDDFCEHDEDSRVFVTRNMTPLKEENIRRCLRTALKNSRCKDKTHTPHSLRHGYGSVLASRGVPIKTISVLMGHSDTHITQNVYIGVSDEDKKEAILKVFH